MPAFPITIFADFDPNPPSEIAKYENGLKDILIRLSNHIQIIETKDQRIIPLISDNSGIFAEDCINLQKHPKLWAKTNRVGQSALTVADGSNTPSTYEALHTKLMSDLKKLSWFNAIDRKKRKAINLALDELQQLQETANSAFLVRLRDMTANQLIKELDKNIDNKHVVIFKKRIEAIKQLSAQELRTSSNCLQYTNAVNMLRNDLLKFNKSIGNKEIDHLAKQLSIVTKRWIDPFYEHPKELTKMEMARKIAKSIIINVAEILAVAAFILFFVFPPASFPVGAAAAIGMLPIFDGFFEVARNIWNGRTPTKSQAAEVGIAVALVLGLTVLAYGVSAIGVRLIQSAPHIAKGMMHFGNIMATVFMRFIDVFLNTVGSILDAFLFKKTLEPKTEEQLSKSKPLSLQKTLKILGSDAVTVEEKTANLRALDELQREQKEIKKECKNEKVQFYVYKEGNQYHMRHYKGSLFQNSPRFICNANPKNLIKAYLIRR